MALSTIGRNQLNTGIDDNSDATAITIDSSEIVMTGKTAANFDTAGFQTASNGQTAVTRASATPFFVNRKTDDGTIIEVRKDNTTVGSIGAKSDDLYINTGDTGIRLNDGNDQIWPVSSSGTSRDAAIDLGNSGVRFKDIYLSGGAYIGGTGSSNALDDYEEGNFTVTVSSGISVSSYDHQLGHYVKVGRQVTAWVFVEYNGSSRTSGHFKVTGLPFASSSDTSNESTFGGFITYQNVFSNAHNIIHVGRNTTEASFYEVDGTDLIGSELSAASGEVRFVVQYTVA